MLSNRKSVERRGKVQLINANGIYTKLRKSLGSKRVEISDEQIAEISRIYGAFREDPDLICEIMEHIIPRIQGSENGVTPDGVAVTTKHFPGGGPRENGFDPHYAAGQWNVYATPGSLQK